MTLTYKEVAENLLWRSVNTADKRERRLLITEAQVYATLHLADVTERTLQENVGERS